MRKIILGLLIIFLLLACFSMPSAAFTIYENPVISPITDVKPSEIVTIDTVLKIYPDTALNSKIVFSTDLKDAKWHIGYIRGNVEITNTESIGQYAVINGWTLNYDEPIYLDVFCAGNAPDEYTENVVPLTIEHKSDRIYDGEIYNYASIPLKMYNSKQFDANRNYIYAKIDAVKVTCNEMTKNGIDSSAITTKLDNYAKSIETIDLDNHQTLELENDINDCAHECKTTVLAEISKSIQELEKMIEYCNQQGWAEEGNKIVVYMNHIIEEYNKLNATPTDAVTQDFYDLNKTAKDGVTQATQLLQNTSNMRGVSTVATQGVSNLGNVLPMIFGLLFVIALLIGFLFIVKRKKNREYYDD